MILEAEENIKQEIERLTNEAFGVFDLENPQPGIDLLIEAYNNIPAPRTKYSESFNLIKYISIGYFRAGMIDESEKWLSDFFESDFNTMGYGESEYLAGKIALKRNNEKLAIQHFVVANQKSEGRVFGSDGDDKANYEFFKSHANEHVRPKGFDEMVNVAILEIEKNNYPYALSLLYDCLNLQLDNPTVHLNKGLCHFELNELDHAADSFTRAYMLEGEDVFKEQDSKYFDFLKTRIEIK
jgi:tetratricopeptide (TPR) repeat protein